MVFKRAAEYRRDSSKVLFYKEVNENNELRKEKYEMFLLS